jgi:hypothetical protein
MKHSDNQFVNALEENIRKRGAMDKIFSYRAQPEISSKVKDILRALHISDWQSEPTIEFPTQYSTGQLSLQASAIFLCILHLREETTQNLILLSFLTLEVYNNISP